jgi:hypothetical protein
MKPFRLLLAFATLLLFIAACAPEKEIVSTPAPAPQPIVDTSPHLCALVPEQAFRLVSGVNEPTTERTNGTDQNGDCRTPDKTPPLLEVWWGEEGTGMPSEHLKFLADGRLDIYKSYGGVTLPADLGNGMAAYLTDGLLAEQPYRVSAKFRCGNKERMIDIYLTQVAKGRDAMKDLTDLMRIAQKRYSQIHDCTLTAG